MSQVNLDADLMHLLQRFHEERVRYILIGGQAVRLNGFLRNTEDIDILLPSSIQNGEQLIKALNFLDSASELKPSWFETDGEAPENIRMGDRILLDLLFAANGETFETLQPYVKTLLIDGTPVHMLNIEGLLKTKTDYREKDLLDKQMLVKLQKDVLRGA